MSQKNTFAAFVAASLLLQPLLSSRSVQASEPAPPSRSNEQSAATKDEGRETTTSVVAKPVELVVTATRTELPLQEVISSATLVTRLDIERSLAGNLVEMLRSVPALDVVQSGGPGQHTAVFIRGAQSEHTLVLVDGIEMNDAISPGRSYDFEHLTTDNVDRAEIIRGPQSTLYGSDAIGGVINIITKKGDGELSGSFRAELGAHATFRERLGFDGSRGAIHYSVGLSRTDSDGVSAAAESYGNTERDGFGSTSFSTRVGIAAASNLDVDLVAGIVDSSTALDAHGGAGGDDPNSVADYRQKYFRAQGRLALWGGLWDQRFGVSSAYHDRAYEDEGDANRPLDRSESSYNSRTTKVDWQSSFNIRGVSTLTFGVETESEEGRSDYYSQSAWGPYASTFESISARTSGVFVQNQAEIGDSWMTTVGMRLDDHSELGSHTTFRVGTAYLIHGTGTKIRGTYGTGFKAPSLYQLYSQYGDRSLMPEASSGWDLGIEQHLLGEKVTSRITLFGNKLSNLIDFDSAAWKYRNIARARTRGVELSAVIRAVEALTIEANYTLTETKDHVTGRPLLRRPRNKLGFAVNWIPRPGMNIRVNLARVGKRQDIDGSSWPLLPVEVEAYALANLAVAYDLGKTVRVFGRIDNLLDAEYEEVFGYGSPGITISAGASFGF